MNSYYPLETLGRGGFGIVQKVANDRQEVFAKKTFSPDTYILANERDDLRKRFKREVMVQSELGGEHVIPVLEMNLTAAAPWFLMPLALKVFDAQIQEDAKVLTLNIEAIIDILNALEFLHDRGYVHRDLNPKNVLFHENKWKLSDFGAILPPDGRSIITVGTVIYTEKYCSPEQRKNFHNVQPSSDIYSFGCILHDIFGSDERIPYAQHTAEGPVGIIIEKCTEKNPIKRPSISVLRELILEALVKMAEGPLIRDDKADEWLRSIDSIDSWKDTKFESFSRFFSQLDIDEKTSEHTGNWIKPSSTPFLTRISSEAFKKIVIRADGVAGNIVEKYCHWVRSTSFDFYFSDIICGRLISIFDNGTPAHKADSFCALVHLGDTHNRWYIMRCTMNRCRMGQISEELAERLKIELKVQELEHRFRRCVAESKTDKAAIATKLADLCW